MKENEFQAKKNIATSQIFIKSENKIRILSDMRSLCFFASHVSFVKTQLEKMFHQNEYINQERGRQDSEKGISNPGVNDKESPVGWGRESPG